MQKSDQPVSHDAEIELLGTLGDRLRHLLDSRDLTVTALARAMSISRQSCYKWLGQSAISDANLHRLSRYFNVSPEWLKFGVEDLSHATSACDINDCLSSCSLKQSFINDHQKSELIWELCLERKTLNWHGNSESLLELSATELPRTLSDLLAIICTDYRDIFLHPLRKAILNGELSTVLVPFKNETDQHYLWLNCRLHANCAGKLIIGSFSATDVRHSQPPVETAALD